MLSTDSIFTAGYAFPVCFTVHQPIILFHVKQRQSVSVLKVLRFDSQEINRERRKLLRGKFVNFVEIYI